MLRVIFTGVQQQWCVIVTSPSTVSGSAAVSSHGGESLSEHSRFSIRADSANAAGQRPLRIIVSAMSADAERCHQSADRLRKTFELVGALPAAVCQPP